MEKKSQLETRWKYYKLLCGGPQPWEYYKGGDDIQEYTYESQDATVILLADSEEDADQNLAELVKDHTIFDLNQIGAV